MPVTTETSFTKFDMPSSLLMDVPALADFNKAWVELTDWLTLLDRVIKSQLVTVGDVEEINDMIIKQKVHAQTFTLAFPVIIARVNGLLSNQ